MNNTHLFIAFLLCIALALTFFFPPVALADDRCWTERAWEDCDDGILFNGYWWRGFWVPGMINIPTHFMPAPMHIAGQAVYYAPGLMEATARYMGFDLSNYIDGVAMMSCADIGQTVWIRWQPIGDWEGPFLVVDCAEWDDHWPIAMYRREVVEVGYKTAERWGMIANQEWSVHVGVCKGKHAPVEPHHPTIYANWLMEIAQFIPAWVRELPSRVIFKAPHQWLIGGKWIDFLDNEHQKEYLNRWIRDAIYRIE